MQMPKCCRKGKSRHPPNPSFSLDCLQTIRLRVVHILLSRLPCRPRRILLHDVWELIQPNFFQPGPTQTTDLLLWECYA